jgi:GDPmannose 4,6-dehydratase
VPASLRALDVGDHDSVHELIGELKPDQCYHFAAHHHSSKARPGLDSPRALSDDESRSFQVNLLGTHALLAALREHAPHCRVFLAGACHVYGNPPVTPQTEDTPMVPDSLYGICKLASLHLGRQYRERHGLYCVTGILYNHESPRRPRGFVTTELARAAAEVSRGKRSEVTVLDPDARVDWGFAPDYVEAMALMLEQSVPEDCILASGALHSVRDFARVAFAHVGLDAADYLKHSAPAQRKPSRLPYSGDISRTVERLGWRPKTSFEQLVRAMVDHHLKALGPA